MENVQNVKAEKVVDEKVVAKETKDSVKEVEKVKRIEEMLDDNNLLIEDEEFKTSIAYKKLSDLTEDDKKKFAKAILKCELKKSSDKKSTYVHMSLKLADNVVLQDSLNQEKSIILKELKPELIGSETEVLVKLVSMLPLKNKKENIHTGEVTIPRAYTCIAPVCEGVVFNGGYSVDRYSHNRTSRAYLKNDTIILIKIHNAKHPESQVKFYDIGEVGSVEDSID